MIDVPRAHRGRPHRRNNSLASAWLSSLAARQVLELLNDRREIFRHGGSSANARLLSIASFFPLCRFVVAKVPHDNRALIHKDLCA
jgi:hypothetical protein